MKGASQRKLNQGTKAGIKNIFIQIEEIASFLAIKMLSAFHRSTL